MEQAVGGGALWRGKRASRALRFVAISATIMHRPVETLSIDSNDGREQFFESKYELLRELRAMKWMARLFLRLTDSVCPSLIDLPTGAGKTDVVVIWILALSWYGLDTTIRKPVPRRLVWVINRRVLVQQVFRLANKLQEKISGNDSDLLADVRHGLARLSGDATDVFRVVQLRGQLIDDREWSVAPTVPQLIIGTVDQIGSRVLFQGYSLGKWSRPLQGALLGIDAWICLDEAHLVPAFVLTLRQIQRVIANQSETTANVFSAVFARLPFWLTELSATPALPRPIAESTFRLLPEDEDDPQLKDRLIAACTRQVKIQWLADGKKAEEAIEKAAAELDRKVGAVAVFVCLPKHANKIATGLGKLFKGRVLKITGRLRGYERGRLEKQEVLRRLRPPERSDQTTEEKETVFLVGTAAAEVGLDADAAALVCDFASLPTLLQRLGRLDRRGSVSRRSLAGECEAPSMTIFATRDAVEGGMRQRYLKLARALRREKEGVSASSLVGRHWKAAVDKEGAHKVNEGESDRSRGAKKGIDPREIVNAATRAVLLGKGRETGVDSIVANPPSMWLKCPIACVTGGPIAVPPLTRALIEHWSGTTDAPNTFLPVHAFLYGILPDDEGTPLISVAFRLEMDVLATASFDEDEGNDVLTVEEQVTDIFRRFPPQRAEFHFVSLADAREWLSSAEASAIPISLFDGERWSVTWDRKDKIVLKPGSTLILPTLARHSVSKLLEGANDPTDEKASRDVLEDVLTERLRYWRRVVRVRPGDYRLDCKDGASRFERVEAAEKSHSVAERMVDGNFSRDGVWKIARYCFAVGTAGLRFEYLKPKKPVQSQFLAEHLRRAEQDAIRISGALAPDNGFLRSLLVEAAKVHDEGKRNCRWQRAMGNPDCKNPVAKSLVERPASTGGFRHEWESLRKMRTCSPSVPDALSESDAQLWFDLWRHLVASHHGHFRPWLADRVLEAQALGKQQQSALRIESAERFARLQRLLGPWRLAYLEALIKSADVAASQPEEEESDEQ